jgi:thiamine kinase-like enzyme
VIVETVPCLQVRFVDFEDAGLGDPAWDLATVLDTISYLAHTWNSPPEPLVEYFLRGYRHADGPGRLYPAIQAVRAVATAWQIAGTEQRGSDAPAVRQQVAEWLNRARAFASSLSFTSRAVA